MFSCGRPESVERLSQEQAEHRHLDHPSDLHRRLGKGTAAAVTPYRCSGGILTAKLRGRVIIWIGWTAVCPELTASQSLSHWTVTVSFGCRWPSIHRSGCDQISWAPSCRTQRACCSSFQINSKKQLPDRWASRLAAGGEKHSTRAHDSSSWRLPAHHPPPYLLSSAMTPTPGPR